MDPDFLKVLDAINRLPPALSTPLGRAVLGGTNPAAPSGSPPVAGPTAAPPQQAPRQDGPRFDVGGMLNRIFSGGSESPHITKDQHVEAAKQGRLRAGLQMILASGPSPVRQNLLQILAKGAIAGQEAYSAAEQKFIQQAAIAGRARALESVRNLPDDQLGRGVRELLSAGAVEEAKVLLDLIEEDRLSAEGQGQDYNLQSTTGVNPATGDAELFTFDPRKGTYTASGIAAPNQDVYERIYDIEEGEGVRGRYGVVAATGESVRLGDAPAPGGGRGGPSAQERQNQRLGGVARLANDELEALDHHLAGVRANVAMEGGIVGAAGRVVATDEQQKASGVALQFINPVVRFLSGAQMNESEAQRYYTALIPRPGERMASIRQKRRARGYLLDAMDSGALQPGEVGPNGEPDLANIDAAIQEALEFAKGGTDLDSMYNDFQRNPGG